MNHTAGTEATTRNEDSRRHACAENPAVQRRQLGRLVMRTETVPTEVEAIAAALVARGVPFHRAVVAFRVAFLRVAMD